MMRIKQYMQTSEYYDYNKHVHSDIRHTYHLVHHHNANKYNNYDHN